ncbi:MAG: sensor histidine kinase [Eubacteriales bacterium]|nr:sensor histidine kinase [Eubacteriales bacterium]
MRFRFCSRSLRSYITMMMTGILTLALTVCGALFYGQTSSTLRTVYQQQMVQQLNTTMQQITEQISLIDSLYMLFMSNNLIYDALENAGADGSNAAAVERQMTHLLITNYIWEEQFIDSVSIYTDGGQAFHVSSIDSDAKRRQSRAIREASDQSYPHLQIITPDSPSSGELYFARNIFSATTGQAIASMIVSVDRDVWIEYLGSSLDNGWSICLYNDDFHLLSLPQAGFPPDENAYLTVSKKLYNLDMYAVVMAPRAALADRLNGSLQAYLFIMCLMILTVLLASYMLSRAATYPILRMIRHINRIADGNYEETIPADKMYEEFRSLSAAFNHLLAEINTYHADHLEKQLLLKNAEIQALQSQINPHFLFNTLNTLAWKAQMSDNPELYQMTISLGQLLKTNVLSRSSSFITLAEELKYIKFYVYLQKMRFEDRIRAGFDIAPGLQDVQLPCFSIQSLVENAFVHGLEPKADNGELLVRVRMEDDAVSVSVQDNGIGFREIPDLAKIQPSGTDSHTHVGLRNLDRRLYLLYGEASRLQIVSTPNVQTTVSFRIPKEPGHFLL